MEKKWKLLVLQKFSKHHLGLFRLCSAKLDVEFASQSPPHCFPRRAIHKQRKLPENLSTTTLSEPSKNYSRHIARFKKSGSDSHHRIWRLQAQGCSGEMCNLKAEFVCQLLVEGRLDICARASADFENESQDSDVFQSRRSEKPAAYDLSSKVSSLCSLFI